MAMTEMLPIVLVPGLICSPRIWAPLVPALWRHGPVTIANHVRDDSMAAIARRILQEAPPRFALSGHSMGGYIAFEIMRQAPERVAKLALLNTQARPDTPEATARRSSMVARAQGGGYRTVVDEFWANFVHPSRSGDAGLQQIVHDMADDVGVDAFLRQQNAIMTRPDSRPTLTAIRCPTLVFTCDTDNTVPPKLSQEMADGIAGSRLVVLENCGHLPQLERAEATAHALVEWLSG
jgi:pimeloyl-ACP methyl ester carboxylesterase